MSNPKGPDGAPMERTDLLWKPVHDAIHQQEQEAVQTILREDGLKGNPRSWTAKKIKGY
jgi:hypothetical protein